MPFKYNKQLCNVLISTALYFTTTVTEASSTTHIISPEVRNKLNTLLGPQTNPQLQVVNESFLSVSAGGQTFFASRDGRYLFVGKVIDTEQRVDLIEQIQQIQRAEKISTIPRDKLLSYQASEERYRITIFTDIDCPFCRKFHQQIPELNAQGVSVDYVMLPRGKKGSEAFQRTAAALCATNPQQAMDIAMQANNKSSQKLALAATAACTANLDEQRLLAQSFGFSATPTILLSNGETVAGFINSQALLARLESL